MHDCKPGTLVHLEQAQGEFVLPDDQVGKLLFITAGSGITPVIGMLRNLFPSTDSGVLRPERSANYDIVVLHVAPSRPDSIFRRDLEALDDAGAIRLVARYDDEHGLLDLDRLTDLVPDLGARTTYACGPSGLLDALTEHHEQVGPHAVHRAVPHRADRRPRRGRHRHLRPQRHRRRGRGRHPDPRRGRGVPAC